MYETSYKALLSLIAGVVGGVSTPVEIEDYKLLITLADRHSVLNILYYAIKDDPALPADYRTAMENKLFTGVHAQLSQEAEMARIAKALNEAGIRFLPIKGASMRAVYPKPEMRISCDVDYFYDKEARPRLGEIFTALGYTEEGSDPNHTGFRRGRVNVEMHHNLLQHLPTLDAYYSDVWPRLLPAGGTAYRMRDEDVYIYHIVHTMKHYFASGTGIRSVLDTYLFLKNKPDLDMAYIEKELRSVKLFEFHTVFTQVADAWFGGKDLPADLADTAAYILGSGTYGLAEQRAANRAGKKTKLGYLLYSAFPPYAYMAEKYPSLRRFPPALPFYWIYRFIRAAMKKDRIGGALRAAGATDKAAQDRADAIMRRVGLDGYK